MTQEAPMLVLEAQNPHWASIVGWLQEGESPLTARSTGKIGCPEPCRAFRQD